MSPNDTHLVLEDAEDFVAAARPDADEGQSPPMPVTTARHDDHNDLKGG
jgi:hypothetical protein